MTRGIQQHATPATRRRYVVGLIALSGSLATAVGATGLETVSHLVQGISDRYAISRRLPAWNAQPEMTIAATPSDTVATAAPPEVSTVATSRLFLPLTPPPTIAPTSSHEIRVNQQTPVAFVSPRTTVWENTSTNAATFEISTPIERLIHANDDDASFRSSRLVRLEDGEPVALVAAVPAADSEVPRRPIGQAGLPDAIADATADDAHTALPLSIRDGFSTVNVDGSLTYETIVNSGGADLPMWSDTGPTDLPDDGPSFLLRPNGDAVLDANGLPILVDAADVPISVPEPSSLLMIGVAATLLRRRRRVG